MEHFLFSTIKSAEFLDIGHHGDCLQWDFSYLLCLLHYNVYLHSLDAEKNNASIILRFPFCCCISVKLADMSYEVANDKIGRVSRFNDFIGRFSRATKPRPQKLAHFVWHPHQKSEYICLSVCLWFICVHLSALYRVLTEKQTGTE